jgi:hypothetical protein
MMKQTSRKTRENWMYTSTESPYSKPTFVHRYGRRRIVDAAKPANQVSDVSEADLLRSSAPANLSYKRKISPRLELQCPACTLRARMDDFEWVHVGSSPHVHCPSCDANLGLPERALKHAA